MALWLILSSERSADAAPVALPLRDGTLTLGRAAGCDVVVADDSVSRKHLQLDVAGPHVSFKDLESSKGTLLNGARAPAGTLKVGDRLRMGSTVVSLATEVPVAVTATPPAVAGRELAAGSGVHAVPGSLNWQVFSAFFEKLGQATHPRELLERLLLGIIDLFKAQRGFVLLKEGSGPKLTPVASKSLANTSEFVAVSSTVYGRALETGAVVFVDNTMADKLCQGAPSLVEEGVPRTVLCGPLKAGDDVVGVIYVDKPRVGSGFDRSHVQAFQAFSDFAAALVAAQRNREGLSAAEGRLTAFSTMTRGDDPLVTGQSESSRELQQLVDAAAKQDVTVLITGETGTGKEMVARALHRSSTRATGPFIAVNCAALPQDIIEAELFGAERGAYTGASERRIGRFELAQGGTLFLDEIGELPQSVQVKLLRILQERTITRLGGTQLIELDFRLVCATNRDLEKAVRLGTFRNDLFYRVNVFRLHLKPLSQRPEDIKPLALHFLRHFATQFAKPIKGFSPEVERRLVSYLWPGNVRELRNAVERAVVLENEELIGPLSLPLGLQASVAAPPDQFFEQKLVGSLPRNYEAAREVFDGAFLRRSFEVNSANIAAVSRETGLARPTVYKWLDKFGISKGKD